MPKMAEILSYDCNRKVVCDSKFRRQGRAREKTLVTSDVFRVWKARKQKNVEGWDCSVSHRWKNTPCSESGRYTHQWSRARSSNAEKAGSFLEGNMDFCSQEKETPICLLAVSASCWWEAFISFHPWFPKDLRHFIIHAMLPSIPQTKCWVK
ncbi:hypothetical protein BS17DRAFT_241078 [Gyrodon lividus]|nr:hypothetical protein BS17DRAFT_241078 [Gyrodon lividus]